MITIAEVLLLHQLSISNYGGADGVRDQGMLESAVSRPFQTFDGADLYPAAIEKAAAIFESILINHPFVDGNKRTGFLAMFALLEMNGLTLTAPQADAYDFTIGVATGENDFDAIVAWLKIHIRPL